MPEKAAIRDLLKTRLRSLTPEQRLLASAAITQQVLAMSEYQQAQTVMLFVSMASEVDTSTIAADAWSKGKRVLVPVANMSDRSMHAVEIRSMAEAKRKTAVGVLEPEAAAPVDPGGIGLVLVPGLGFGPAGQRIGRGAGFYDRFLGNPRLQAVRCGLAFELQVIEGIPMTGHDAALDMLVTETGLRRFARTIPVTQ